jgi:hypothetical protein
MKILLIGEYSGVHYELQNSLKQKRYDVKTISSGDGYKNFKPDFLFKRKAPVSKIKIFAIFNLIKLYLGTEGLLNFLYNWSKLKKEINGYDVIQIINPIALEGYGSIANLLFLKYLKKTGAKIYLCCLGDDYYWVKSCLSGKNKYQALKNLSFSDFIKQSYSTKYTHGFLYKTTTNFAILISEKIIPGLYDYKRVYEWSPKVTQLIPLPISLKKNGSPLKLEKDSNIIIFHGWQLGKEKRKGNDVFDKVVKKLISLYPNRIEYKVVQNVPYDEYITSFNSAHIALDQCYSYDKGVNGLLYMAAGKVAFTGLEPKALSEYPFYNPKIKIGINGTSDEDYLLKQLIELIENPDLIEEISKNAIEFVTKNHESSFVADLYLKSWEIVD